MIEYGDIVSHGKSEPPDRDHLCFDTSCKNWDEDWCPLEECDYKLKGEGYGA